MIVLRMCCTSAHLRDLQKPHWSLWSKKLIWFQSFVVGASQPACLFPHTCIWDPQRSNRIGLNCSRKHCLSLDILSKSHELSLQWYNPCAFHGKPSTLTKQGQQPMRMIRANMLMSAAIHPRSDNNDNNSAQASHLLCNLTHDPHRIFFIDYIDFWHEFRALGPLRLEWLRNCFIWTRT